MDFKNKAYLFILLLGLLLIACAPAAPESNSVSAENDGTTLYVGAEQVDCTGVAPQTCLLVKEDANGEYAYFYDAIEGFEWEAGYEYELSVRVTEVEDPPADGSSLRYELIKIISKSPVDS